jgi:hypothetical protein
MIKEIHATRSVLSTIALPDFALASLLVIGCSGPVVAEQAMTSVPTPIMPADSGVHLPPPMVAVPPSVCSTFETVSEYQTYLTLEDGGMSNFKPLTDPEFVGSDQADFLVDSDIVLGISHGDEHRAYPVRQIWYHHVVNDRIGGQPYLVTY